MDLNLAVVALPIATRAETLERLRLLLAVHIAAGALGLLSGYLALSVAKGGAVHRKSGMVFVYAMVAMAVAGTVIAAAEGEMATMIAACLTAYLVITALNALRPPTAHTRRLDVATMVAGAIVGVASVTLGMGTLAVGTARDPKDAIGLFVFGAVALWAVVGDVRRLWFKESRGVPRLRRHLWRMCFALFIAAFSFFLGQAQVFPKAVRIPTLLSVPVLLVLATMTYWLWRVRTRRLVAGVLRPRDSAREEIRPS